MHRRCSMHPPRIQMPWRWMPAISKRHTLGTPTFNLWGANVTGAEVWTTQRKTESTSRTSVGIAKSLATIHQCALLSTLGNQVLWRQQQPQMVRTWPHLHQQTWRAKLKPLPQTHLAQIAKHKQICWPSWWIKYSSKARSWLHSSHLFRQGTSIGCD